MRDPLLIILTALAALAVLAVACGLTAHLVRKAVRKDTDRMWDELDWAAGELQELHGQVGKLTGEVAILRNALKDRDQACETWHDLVGVHKHAIANLNTNVAGLGVRVGQLEQADVLPSVEPVRELLFAATARDLLLPKPPAIDTRPHADIPGHVVARAAVSRPADNSETGFTREHAAAIAALEAVSGELVVTK